MCAELLRRSTSLLNLVTGLEKNRAATLSLISNSALSVSKIAVGIMTGSAAVFSDGIHSFTDVAASLSTAVSVRAASKPADFHHRFGHQKFENVSGVFESILLLGAGVVIVAEALGRIAVGYRITDMWIAIAVMIVSAVVDFSVALPVRNASKRADSIALRVDYAHIATDALASVGVIVALLLVQLTGNIFFDTATAFMIAIIMGFSGLSLLRESGGPLVDVKISDSEEERIREILLRYSDTCGYHMLRTRKAGNVRFVDFHLTFPLSITLLEAHDISDRIEAELMAVLQNCNLTIHMEPVGVDCESDVHDGKKS